MIFKRFMKTRLWKEQVRNIDRSNLPMEQKVEIFKDLYRLFEKNTVLD